MSLFLHTRSSTSLTYRVQFTLQLTKHEKHFALWHGRYLPDYLSSRTGHCCFRSVGAACRTCRTACLSRSSVLAYRKTRLLLRVSLQEAPEPKLGNQLEKPQRPQPEHLAELPEVVFKEILGEPHGTATVWPPSWLPADLHLL